jgi:hypothetical protein
MDPTLEMEEEEDNIVIHQHENKHVIILIILMGNSHKNKLTEVVNVCHAEISSLV